MRVKKKAIIKPNVHEVLAVDNPLPNVGSESEESGFNWSLDNGSFDASGTDDKSLDRLSWLALNTSLIIHVLDDSKQDWHGLKVSWQIDLSIDGSGSLADQHRFIAGLEFVIEDDNEDAGDTWLSLRLKLDNF